MNKPQTILLATENRAKSEEMTDVLHRLLGTGITVISLKDLTDPITLPDESGETFCQIAAQKAAFVSQATGLPAIGDDSGLCVDILNGAPGIRSRRWAGEGLDDHDRNRALLSALSSHPENRTARIVTCVALSVPGFDIVNSTGECHGTIIHTPRGNNGFGYDPIFELTTSHLTLAELTNSEKNEVSHRSRALENLVKKLNWTQF